MIMCGFEICVKDYSLCRKFGGLPPKFFWMDFLKSLTIVTLIGTLVLSMNCGKSNAMTTNYFTIFLQTVVMANFLLVLIMAHQ